MQWFFANFLFDIWNAGLTAGLMLGVMLILRPALCKLLTAQQRAWLGMLGWYGTGFPPIFGLLGRLHILPVTFRDLITPRTGISTYDVPAYLPENYQGAGEYTVALPGGKAVWVEFSNGMVLALLLLWVGVAVALVLWLTRRTNQLKALGRQGQLLADDDPLLFRGLSRRPDDKPVAVRLCRGLPTSFVYQNGEKIDGVRYNMIYLQEELSPQRRELVLRHEWNHIRLHHGWMKCWASALLVMFWWNPILWVAYYFFCRDLEMACDEKTLDDLPGPEQRKQYAQTLVELAAGKILWDVPLAFGECDAVPRVKAAVAWHKPKEWVWMAKWCAFALVFLFFVGGPRNIPYLPQEVVRYWQQAAVEVELPGGWTPAERWLGAEGDGRVTLLAKDTQGIWYQNDYLWDGRDKEFKGGGPWETLDENPDLTGFQQGLW
jgi:hypothetical protein